MQIPTTAQSRISWLLIVIFSALFFFIAAFSGGVSDSDSIQHYLFSRYAFKHPHLFLDLWNKPVFTLLTAPFAQFGFVSMKLFNAICGCLSLILLFKISSFYSKNYNPLILVLAVASAFHLAILNSALTEPLFDLALLFALYLLLKDKISAAALVFSCLPFIRQEGYLIIGFMFVYFGITRNFKPLFLLFSAHIVLTIAGYFHYQDLLWIFKNNPNAFYSHYGNGGWFDYFHKLAYILGKPLYFFVAAGIIALIIFFFRSKNKFEYIVNKLHVPVYCFLLVVAAHAIFWKFGLFKSLGMERNIVTVFSCAVITSFIGLSAILNGNPKKNFNAVIISVSCLVLLIYPFYPDPQKVQIPGDFKLTEEQKMISEAVDQVKPLLNEHKLYTGHPYVHLLLENDPFDSTRVAGIYKFYPRKNPGEKCAVLWEKRLSVIEYGVSLKDLEADTTLKRTFYKVSDKNEAAVFVSK
jgi:hypothetical protein